MPRPLASPLGILILVSLGLSAVRAATAAEPVNPDLIPEARRVLEYLESVQGKKMLSGISGSQDAQPQAVLHMTGREPAIAGGDMAGYHRKWDKLYHQVMQNTVDKSIRWWREKGGIVALQYHWMKPGDPEGSAWIAPPRGTGRLDLTKAVTPGTEEHRAVMADLKVTADYLEQLADARVPVLWRPFHEIDGGWFWWTDAETPENTAALWRLMFDYFVKERKLHNLIWVYNAAHVSHTRKPPAATFEEEVAHRRRHYPDAEYVDIASIDTYANPKLGYDPARFRLAEGRLMLDGLGETPGRSQPPSIMPMHRAYEIETEVSIEGEGLAGLMLFGAPEVYIGLAIGPDGKLHRVQEGFRRYHRTDEPIIGAPRATLRIVNEHQDVRFHYRLGDGPWEVLQPGMDVSAVIAAGLHTLRPALFATGGARGAFEYFAYRPLEE